MGTLQTQTTLSKQTSAAFKVSLHQYPSGSGRVDVGSMNMVRRPGPSCLETSMASYQHPLLQCRPFARDLHYDWASYSYVRKSSVDFVLLFLVLFVIWLANLDYWHAFPTTPGQPSARRHGRECQVRTILHRWPVPAPHLPDSRYIVIGAHNPTLRLRRVWGHQDEFLSSVWDRENGPPDGSEASEMVAAGTMVNSHLTGSSKKQDLR